MAENRLYPAYVRLNYHSLYGAHNAIIPTREWSATPLVPLNDGGSYTNWNGFPCDGQEMIEDLCGALAAFNPASTIFDSAVIYTLDTPESPAIPRATVPLTIVGTNATPGWFKATMRTWFFRDTEWQPMKVVQLDTSTDDNWDATNDVTGNAPAEAVRDAITAGSWAWASRNGEKPQTLTRVLIKLNDKLRAEYGMA